jgi:hypothetical protein
MISMGYVDDKEFFMNLIDGEEYQIIKMQKDINQEIFEHINGLYVLTVDEKNDYYKEDEMYKKLSDEKTKALKALDTYKSKLKNK